MLWDKRKEKIFQANIPKKQTNANILISDQIDFKPRGYYNSIDLCTKHKAMHFIEETANSHITY